MLVMKAFRKKIASLPYIDGILLTTFLNVCGCKLTTEVFISFADEQMLDDFNIIICNIRSVSHHFLSL